MSFKAALLLLLLLAVAAPAQRRQRDPLTEAEADQMREVADDPVKRIRLIIKFAKARMQAIEQLRGDPKMAADRGKQVHDLLQDFTAIVDELDDNVNMYAKRKDDISKAVGDVIVADSDFQLKLRSIKETAQSDPKAAEEAKDYQFVLENAVDAVNASADNARDLLDEIAREKAEATKKKKK